MQTGDTVLPPLNPVDIYSFFKPGLKCHLSLNKINV